MSMRRMALAGVMAASMAASTGIAVTFIKEREGRSLVAYQDSVGVWTICDGETVGVRMGDTATHEQCDAQTLARVTETAQRVAALVTVPMTPQTHAAMTSFAYNVGMANFERSTLLRRMNKGDVRGACNEIVRWVYAKGRDCRNRANQCFGIVKRREAERTLCLDGIEGQPV